MLRSTVYNLAISLVLTTFLECRPKTFIIFFTRLFLTERHMQVRHETNTRYVFMSYVIDFECGQMNFMPLDRYTLKLLCCPLPSFYATVNCESEIIT